MEEPGGLVTGEVDDEVMGDHQALGLSVPPNAS